MLSHSVHTLSCFRYAEKAASHAASNIGQLCAAMNSTNLLAVLLCSAATLSAAPLSAQQRGENPEAVVLVATPILIDPNYRRSVIVAVPIENNRHLGVIINRPTQRSLASLFPDHQPSKRVAEPVFFGGPVSRGAVVAVVHTSKNPGRGTIVLTGDMYLAITVNVVDRIIEETPNDARYYVGYVIWASGQLRAEVDRKLWYVLDANSDVVFRKDTSNLWEDLSQLARATTASAGDRNWLALAAFHLQR
jgi:putative transcriptional regulator